MPSEVPDGWRTAKYGEIADIRTGFAFKSARFVEDGGLPIVRMSNLKDGRLALRQAARVPRSDTLGLAEFALIKGDFLVGLSGSLTNWARVHADDLPCYLNQRVGCVRPSNDADTRFISYLYLSSDFQGDVLSRAGGAAQLNVSPSQLGEIPVLLPPLPEQKKIAAILSSVDDAIQAKRAVIEQARRVKEGLLQDLLMRGIGHTRFKQTEIGEIPESWSCGKVGDLVTTMKSGLSRRLQSEDIGVAVLISGNLQEGTLATDDLKYWYECDPQGADISAYVLNDGDLLLCFINSISQIGKVCVFRDIGRPAIYTTNLFRIVPSQGCTSEFLHALISSQLLQRQIQIITKPAVNQASFTKPDFLRIHVPIPPLSEQAEIVAALHEVDKAIEGGGRKLDSLALVKEGLLQGLLTGKVRVAL